MSIEDKYIKASRYDTAAARHNFLVFHCRLLNHPWQALSLAILMAILAANGFFNLIDSPRWNLHPWMGWMIGAIAFLPACYFLFNALSGFFARDVKGKD